MTFIVLNEFTYYAPKNEKLEVDFLWRDLFLHLAPPVPSASGRADGATRMSHYGAGAFQNEFEGSDLGFSSDHHSTFPACRPCSADRVR